MDKQIFVIQSKGQAYDLASRIANINPQNKNQPMYMVTVEEYKTTRSKAQNRMMWMWLKLIADHINEHQQHGKNIFTDDDMHEWFKHHFLENNLVEFMGEIIRKTKTTTKLTTKEFTDYLEKIDQYSAEHLGLILPHPEDLYLKAMELQQKRKEEDEI